MGITYDFSIPDIGRDQWNNTIDDVSILSFIQGMPMGYETYYNNYSMGGARIIQAPVFYSETVKENGSEHNIYHKEWCPLIPKHNDGTIWYYGYVDGYDYNEIDLNSDYFKVDEGGTEKEEHKKIETGTLIPRHSNRWSSGIKKKFKTEYDAIQSGYYPCSYCM